MDKSFLSSHLFDCQLGKVLVTGNERGVRAIVLRAEGQPDSIRQVLSESLGCTVLATPSSSLVKASHQMSSYLDGKRELFSFDVNIQGTPFQRQVWDELCQIPYGETRSYQDIAEAIGRPTAVRAVANACGQNPLPLVIPCHRVIASDGSLGGFSAGVDIKRRLLNLEGSPMSHLPLFQTPPEEGDTSLQATSHSNVLSVLPDRLSDWLRLQLGLPDTTPDVAAMTPEGWLADVLETSGSKSLGPLAEYIAHSAVTSEQRVVRQIAEELVAACLTLALAENSEAPTLGPLLRAAALIDSPFYEVTCRRLLNRSATPESTIEELSAILRSVLDGSLSVSRRIRDRTVDLWVLVEERQPTSVWGADSADDPSALYAAHGLWREALIMAENALALGQHDPEIMLMRISELHEKLDELPEAYDATLRLVSLSDSSDAKQRLRELADRIKEKDSNEHME